MLIVVFCCLYLGSIFDIPIDFLPISIEFKSIKSALIFFSPKVNKLSCWFRIKINHSVLCAILFSIITSSFFYSHFLSTFFNIITGLLYIMDHLYIFFTFNLIRKYNGSLRSDVRSERPWKASPVTIFVKRVLNYSRTQCFSP